MEKQKKEIFLKVLNVEEDLNGIKNELSNLLEKYPQNVTLKELKHQNEILKKSEVIEKVNQNYLNNLEKKYSKKEFKQLLDEYDTFLEEIKNWLNNTAKKYIENNFEQKDLIVYWFENISEIPIIEVE